MVKQETIYCNFDVSEKAEKKQKAVGTALNLI